MKERDNNIIDELIWPDPLYFYSETAPSSHPTYSQYRLHIFQILFFFYFQFVFTVLSFCNHIIIILFDYRPLPVCADHCTSKMDFLDAESTGNLKFSSKNSGFLSKNERREVRRLGDSVIPPEIIFHLPVNTLKYF